MSVLGFKRFELSPVAKVLVTCLIVPGTSSAGVCSNLTEFSECTVTTSDAVLQLMTGENNNNYSRLIVSSPGGDASLTILGAGNSQDTHNGILSISDNERVGAVHAGYNGGAGSIVVDNGAKLSVAGEYSPGDVYLGYSTNYDSSGSIIAKPAAGKMTIDNSSSVISDKLFVGRSYNSRFGTEGDSVSDGYLKVVNQSKLSVYALFVGSSDGHNTKSSGEVIIDNESVVNATSLIIGNTSEFNNVSSGFMTVDNGSKFNAKEIYIGSIFGSGVMNIDNSSHVTNRNLHVGVFEGHGTLSIDNGSVLTTDKLRVGMDGGYGSVSISRSGELTVNESSIVSNGALNIGAAPSDTAIAGGKISGRGSIILLTDSVNNVAGKINLNHTDDDIVFTPSVTGTGILSAFSGTTTLSGINIYEGDTIVYDGTLRAGSHRAFSPESNFHMKQDGALDLNGISQVIGSLSNAGTTYFNQKGDTAGTVLTVLGDYHGSDGSLVFNSVLGGDDSVTDTLYVGGNADGSTNVKVNNLGGKGSQTVEGIKLISVEGTVAKGTEFRQNGRIVAGAYDYSLTQRRNDWYLTSEASLPPVVPGPLKLDPADQAKPPVVPGPLPVDPTDTIKTPVAPEPLPVDTTDTVKPPILPAPLPVDTIDRIKPVDPEIPEPPMPPVAPETLVPPVGPDTEPGKRTNITRPEAGSYIANLAASEMFFTRLEDRGREHIYTDPITGVKKHTSMWLHSKGRHLDSNDSSGQLSTRENRYTIQLGGDVIDGTFTGNDSWRLGLMAGYGNSHSSTSSGITGYRSKGDADGYSMGIYSTWFENADRRSGAWMDTWLQFAWFSNSVQGEGLSTEKYNAGGLQTSVEAGYAFVVPGGKYLDYIIEPQAQAMWNGVKTDEIHESNGTVVKNEGTNNLHTRLGVKGSMDITDGDKSDTIWKPYMAVNWHHNTKKYGVKMDDVSLSVSGAKNTVELKAGAEGQLTEKLLVWGGVSGQAGSYSYRDVGGFLGVRYGF